MGDSSESPQFHIKTMSKELEQISAQVATHGDAIADLDARLAALESAPSAPADAVAAKTVALKGETFKVGGDKYQAVYPKFHFEGKDYTEDDLLENPTLQKKLVEGGFGVIRKVAGVVALLLMFAFGMQAQSLTINPTTSEVVAALSKTRDFYQMKDLLFIYKNSNSAFEMQYAETREKLWGGKIDSVAITGCTTTAQKFAKLRTWCLETTTTTGYRCFIGRGGLEYFYNASKNQLQITHASNDQMLWYGSIDSLQVTGLSGASAKLGYLRNSVNRTPQTGLFTGGDTPTIAAGAAAGASPTVSIVGNQLTGEITITAGASGTTTTGVIATITLPVTAINGTRAFLQASTASNVKQFVTTTTNTFVVNADGTAMTGGATSKWTYWTVQY
jgi:hypothetical protein